jgi:hypothetical protein
MYRYLAKNATLDLVLSNNLITQVKKEWINHMQTKGNFLLMELSEFQAWLEKQVITRAVSKVQFHHTASPNYTTRKMVNGVATQDHFKCLEGMRDYHIITNGWSATGQNITIFEDGKVAISLDRDLNKTPAGITGQNTGQICIENIGNFDKGGDTMTAKQREAIIHVYACLAKKFNLPIDTDHFVYHAWFTASGTRLADYTPGKSSKSCPGTNFFGAGNTVASAKTVVFPLIQAELNRLNAPVTPPQPVPSTDIPQEITVYYNTVKDTGVLYNNKTYVKLTKLAEVLGFEAGYDNATKKATINGKELQDTLVVDGRAFIQARPIVDAFGGELSWNNDTKVLKVTK